MDYYDSTYYVYISIYIYTYKDQHMDQYQRHKSGLLDVVQVLFNRFPRSVRERAMG